MKQNTLLRTMMHIKRKGKERNKTTAHANLLYPPQKNDASK